MQSQVGELNKQAMMLDARFRRLQTENAMFRVDADMSESMNEIMSQTVVKLR